MKTVCFEFAPLERERASELEEIINGAARERRGVIIDPNDRGITGTGTSPLISPNENTNVLVRYQRHY
ncbi:MAG TPA: hypothetical protein VMU04_18560 [Candidatus Acidoferrum sp.]|nr:hypothetical protein [Candidatus Acidoferrum sp.]